MQQGARWAPGAAGGRAQGKDTWEDRIAAGTKQVQSNLILEEEKISWVLEQLKLSVES